MAGPSSGEPHVQRDLVVVGTSLGGGAALRRLASRLPPALPAAVCVVQHVHASAPASLADGLRSAGPLPAATARDGDPLEAGRIAVAPPDRHLLVGPEELRVRRGPRENRHRPAIDALFRSAAVRGGSRTIGVLLTGLLDDGVAGLQAIAHCGGTVVVQDPQDAEHPDLPSAALRVLKPDHCLALEDIAALLAEIAGSPAPSGTPAPESLAAEVRIAEGAAGGIRLAEDLGGAPSSLSCPECGGPLWEHGGPAHRRYRCHTGHGFSRAALETGQAQALEESLWVALRTLNERAALLRAMADDASRVGGTYYTVLLDRLREVEGHAHTLHDLLSRPSGMSDGDRREDDGRPG